ncbi:MAG: HAMP domain-containing sensor histidine kinase [Ignavibacteriaceae bacterium]
MFSIKSKIILAYTFIFGLMLTGFSIIIYQSTKQAEFSKLDANLKSYSVSLQTEIEEELGESHSLNLKNLSSIRFEGLSGVRYQLFNLKGNKVLSDTLLSFLSDSSFKKVKKRSSFFEKVKFENKSYSVLWSSFETEDDSLYFLETAASMNDAYADLDRLFYLFIIIIPIGLILTGFTAYVISKAAFRPIAQMADTAKNISGKNLDKRLDFPKTKDEVRTLGETLNEMIERIDKAFKSQRQFIADASHEIRTPLTIIQTELELAERKLKDDEAKESINIALNEIDGLTKLTNSLLTLARLDSLRVNLELSNVRLDELLTDCVQSINQTALKKKVRINLSITDAVEIKADKEKLKSVFLNLIDNAIKYSNAGAGVSVTLNKIENEKVVVTVEDEGEGISPEELPHIFKRFYRSNEIRAEVSGSGLGLAIAKEIIEMHHGEITVESNLGKGTIFKVIVPV